ncbi:MAG: DUF1080 domain-containing protein [Planctomycetales bacterium]|nr:DUF1080 domain-containing protein [Planctomycetales bacterium]
MASRAELYAEQSLEKHMCSPVRHGSGFSAVRSAVAVAKLLAAVFCLSGATTASADTETTTTQDGFVAIFDGKTLDGWSVMPSTAKQAWKAEDGKIVGDGDLGRSYLQFDGNTKIADFELKFKYRFPKLRGNSGVNVRSIKDETGKRLFKSYHVDLGHVGIGDNVLGAWDFHTPGRKEHGVPRGKRLMIDEDDNATYSDLKDAIAVQEIKKGDWNDVHVIVKGNYYRFSINRKPSAEFVEHLPPAKRLQKGAIQLQLHDPGMVVEFKDLLLKVIK